MGSPPASPTSPSPRPHRRRGGLLLPVAALAAAASFGLVCTNPAPVDFEAFAAERLADLAVHELCHDDGLPMLLRLVVQNCAELIGSQRAVFGQLVLRQSERLNFGLFSLYRTNLGGQRLWAGWHLPHYGVLTLAVAGQFVVLRTTERAP